MMYRNAALALLVSFAFSATPVFAADPATPAPSPNAAEGAFVARIQADLNKRFPTTADAEKAGYIRFTDEDDTGVISYANRQWTSADAAHPSQLWYDVKGRLVGADFSVPATATKPSLWGIDPTRWSHFGQHIHYGLAGPDGTVKFGGTSAKKYEAAGGDPLHPTAAGLVKMGVAPSADQVKFVFVFPAIWDLEVWTLPNPSGAFAEKNPNLVPSANAKSSM
jgi:hypothetical protein